MNKIIKNLLGTTLFGILLTSFFFSGVAQAVPNPNVAPAGSFLTNDLGGGALEIIFDQPVTGDVDGNADGLLFNLGGGLTLTVTSNSGNVRMDDPANGGLGSLGTGTDNLELGEILTFTFNQTITLDDILFNGLIGQDGHQDPADGWVNVGGFDLDAANFDGIADPPNGAIAGITSFTVAPTTVGSQQRAFEGYVEGITIIRDVPEPATLALLGLGLFGIFFGARRRKV